MIGRCVGLLYALAAILTAPAGRPRGR